MKKEIRTIVYDDELHLESYRIEGTRQSFPNHFHEHYVLGLVEAGQRRLIRRHFGRKSQAREYLLDAGSIVIFNPGDNHACVQVGGGSLDYRGLNISRRTMRDWLGGQKELPDFGQNVICDAEISEYLRALHEMIMQGDTGLAKEENWLFLLDSLIRKYGQPLAERLPEYRQEIDRACTFMEQHFSERIYLEQICRYTGLSKSALLRAFTKAKGLTPYRYLENIRINEAKKLLAQGVRPLEAAMRTGFTDQSHFTNYFGSFIGLTPGAYRDIFSRQNGQRDKN